MKIVKSNFVPTLDLLNSIPKKHQILIASPPLDWLTFAIPVTNLQPISNKKLITDIMFSVSVKYCNNIKIIINLDSSS